MFRLLAAFRTVSRPAILVAVLALGLTALPQLAKPASAGVPSGMEEVTAFSGLVEPTVFRFSPDGRVFVGEKSGLIKVFDNLNDTTPDIFADLRTQVHNFWDRGLLGMALAPNFPTNPSVYVAYTYDAAIGGTAPRWGTAGATSDGCPNPPGATTDGCVVSARVDKLTASGNTSVARTTLVEDWCQQFPSHSIGTVTFGADGMLYVSGGDGGSFIFADYGQAGNPVNPCGDPPGGVGATLTSPTAEGGALRAQDLRTTGDPTGLNGSIIRIDPNTGAGAPGNPLASSSDANARRIIAYGTRNPFRMTIRPGTNEVWIGDVGWGDYEEIDRIANPTAAQPMNFGWPCYEGPNRQGSFDAANLNICENLYNENSAVTPYFSYHQSEVVGGATTCTGSSSISGVAFAPTTGGAYPAAYNGALFFSDYSRNCIWVMKAGANGLPDPTKIEPFVTPAAGPANLEMSPSGELYYADFNGGRIQRIKSTTTPPVTTCATGSYVAEYFNNMTLSGSPVLSRCETTINNDWGVGGPGNGANNDQFSTRWSGQHNFAAGTYEFSVTADDGVRLYVDNNLVIDQWIDQPATTYKAQRTLAAGLHTVKVEYYEKGGDAVAKASWTQIGTPPPTCANDTYSAEYFNNMTLSGAAVLTRCETTINNDWGTGGPGNGVNVDAFSTRWTGQHNFAAGNYEFSVTADDGVRLYVDNSVVIDQWKDQAATTYKAQRTLTAGLHTVRVEYFENGGEAVAKASWTLVGSPPPPPPTCTDGTFSAQYFNNVTLTGTPVLSRCESTINNDWGVGGPGNGVNVDGFSTRWSGQHNFAAGTYEFSVTADDGVRLYVDDVLVIDQWKDQAATNYKAQRITTSGLHTVRVDYFENGGDAVAKASWLQIAGDGQSPVPSITTPIDTTTWAVGDTINFSGTATDPQQGVLPASALSWTWIMQHCPSTCHSHTIQTFDGVSSGSFVAPDHDYPSHLELRLTATDAQGNKTTVSRSVQPKTVQLTFQTNPPGLSLGVGLASQAAPFTRTAIVGSAQSLSATSPQTLNGATFNFTSWSDGGGQNHNIVAPAAPTTYTANFTQTGGPTYSPVAKVNFQPADAPTVAGYAVDSGEVFGDRGNGLTYGWTSNIATATRDRNAVNSSDQRYDTLIHSGATATQKWELAVPNGTYRVHVVMGDPSYVDSVYKLEVEGQLAINATPTAQSLWQEATVEVVVSDGKLTLGNAAGAANNKLNYLDIDRRTG